MFLEQRELGDPCHGGEMARGQPRRAHHAFLFKDVIAIILIDHEVGWLEVCSIDELVPPAIESFDRRYQVACDGLSALEGRVGKPPARRACLGEHPKRLDRAREGPSPTFVSGCRARPLSQPEVHHFEQVSTGSTASEVHAVQSGLEILPATRECREVEEPHQLFDFRLDVAVHTGQRLAGFVHDCTLGRPEFWILDFRFWITNFALAAERRRYFPRSGGWGNVTSLFKLRR